MPSHTDAPLPNWRENLAWGGLFLMVRLVRLSAIPIFFDEAVYLRWAQQIVRERASPFISIEEGVPPALVWLAAPLVRWLPDPLVAGRLVTVAAGLATLVGVVRLVRETGGPVAGHWAAILVISSPMLTVYDRLAVYEALLAAEIAWLWYFAARFLRDGRWSHLTAVGVISLAGTLTKSSILVALLGLIGALLVVGRQRRCWPLAAAIVSGAAVGSLALTPWTAGIAAHNTRALDGLIGSLTHPLDQPLPLVGVHLGWLAIYLTPVPLLVAAAAPFLSTARLAKQLAVAVSIQFIGMAILVPRDLANPRYLVILAPPLLALAVFGLERLSVRKLGRIVFWLGMVAPAAANSALLIWSPLRAVLPSDERSQLLIGSPSGHGVLDMAGFLRRLHPEDDFTVRVEGTSTAIIRGLQLYLPPERVRGIDPRKFLTPDVLIEEVEEAGERNSYLVTHEFQFMLRARSLMLIAEFPKPEGQYILRLYRLGGRPAGP